MPYSETPTARGIDALLDVLEVREVDRIFVCPGSTEASFLSGTRERGRPDLTLVTHESVAMSAADGYARVSGRPGVAYLHANVGLANAIAHLPGAQLGCSPVVLLNGLKATDLQANRGFTTAPYMRDYVRQHVKWAWQSLDPSHVAEDVERAFRVAMSEPRGPVWVGLPQDVLEAAAQRSAQTRPSLVFDRTRPSREGMEALQAWLATARRPLLVAGPEIAERGASELLGELARRLDSPVLMEDRRSLEWATYATDDPYFAGFYDTRDERLGRADVVTLLGVRRMLDFEQRTAPLDRTGAVLQTSGAPEFLAEPPGVDVAVAGDVEHVLRALLEAFPAPPTGDIADERAAWREFLGARAAGPPDGPGSEAPSDAMAVSELLAALAEVLPAESLVVCDATTSHGQILRLLPRPRPRSLMATTSGSLGWGLGAAVGAATADPSRPVVAVVGDGVTQFGVQALWTAARQNLHVVFVVIDNRSYAAVGAALRRHGDLTTPVDELPGKDLSGAQLEVVAQGLGVAAQRVETVTELQAAFTAALHRSGPTLIDAVTDSSDLGPSARAETA